MRRIHGLSLTPLPRVPVLVMLMLVAAACMAEGSPQYHGKDLAETGWSLVNTPQRCEMVHVIPRYGRAVFWQIRQDDLHFALYVKQPPVADARASVRAVPPSWKHDSQTRELGELPIAQGVNPIRTGRQLALRLYYELGKGMAPQFQYLDWADGTDQVTVTLSPVHFLRVHAEFLECSRKLPGLAPAGAGSAHRQSASGTPANAAIPGSGIGPSASAPVTGDAGDSLTVARETADRMPVDEHLVHFATDSAELTATAQHTLSNLAANGLSAPGHRTIINGHADLRGTDAYNDRLSARRAQAVRDYLIRAGVPADRIETRHFGEQKPLDPRNNERAWARNRRVSVSLDP